MNFTDFAQRVSIAKQLNPRWFELEHDPPASESQIESAEAQLGVVLPDDYKEFARTFGGGFFAFVTIFSPSPGDWNIVDANKKWPIRDFVTFSDNGTGDVYGFKVNGGRCSSEVSLWDHEEQRVKATPFSDLFEYLVDVGLTA